MKQFNRTPSPLQTDGVLQEVDTIQREVGVVVNCKLMIFVVPPDCTVLLNGERVKLRLLQSTDRVRVFYDSALPGLLTAHCLEAQAGILLAPSL